MPCAKPVPMALTTASLAAKRIARKRALRAWRRNWASSSGQQQAAHEMLAEAGQGRLHALELHHVGANAENHRAWPPS